jgi:NADP-dependent 3-hydroxy acid dehydrogenase YdfG
MTTVAIVGAGLGVAAARRFGQQGSDVTLLARRQEHVDEPAAQLTAERITAHGYAADVRAPASHAHRAGCVPPLRRRPRRVIAHRSGPPGPTRTPPRTG